MTSSRNRRRRRSRKTRNKMLITVCVMVIAYTIFEMVLVWRSAKLGYSIQLDSTLTTEVFGFAKWVVVSGASITVAKTVKGQTNSDETERIIPPEG